MIIGKGEPTALPTTSPNSTHSLGNYHRDKCLLKGIIDGEDIEDLSNISIEASIVISSSTLYIKPRTY